MTAETPTGAGAREDGPFTQDELMQMFGSTLPIEAVKLLWGSPGDVTLSEVRAQLRRIAADRHKAHAATLARQVEEMAVALDRLIRAARGGNADHDNPYMLRWIADRLVNVHGEKAGTDYILALRERAAMLEHGLSAARATLARVQAGGAGSEPEPQQAAPPPPPRVGDKSSLPSADGADWRSVLAMVRYCANQWEPDARLVGNVRAGDIMRACDAALQPEPQPVGAGERVRHVKRGLGELADLEAENARLRLALFPFDSVAEALASAPMTLRAVADTDPGDGPDCEVLTLANGAGYVTLRVRHFQAVRAALRGQPTPDDGRFVPVAPPSSERSA